MASHSTAARALNMLDIATEICSWLSLAESSLAKGISYVWHDMVQLRLRKAFAPRRHVGRYFNNWIGFVALMASRDVLLAGVAILEIFDDRVDDPPLRVLEILVEAAMGPDVMAFVASQGYVEMPYSAGPPLVPAGFVMPPPYLVRPSYRTYAVRFVERVYRMVRPAALPGECRVLDVVYTMYSPALTIARSEDTTRMTFFTWNRIYCLFPIGTLLQRRGLYVSQGDGRFRPGPSEIIDYTLGTSLDAEPRPGSDEDDWGSFGPQLRWFGDQRTFVADIPLPAIPGLVVSPYNIGMNGFELSLLSAIGPSEHRTNRGVIYIPKMTSMPLDAPCLDGWSYAASPPFYAHVTEYMLNRARAHGMFWRYEHGSSSVVEALPALRDSFWSGEPDEEDTDSMPSLQSEQDASDGSEGTDQDSETAGMDFDID